MDNQEAFVQELKIANENILKLTLVLEHYTEKTDEKLVDYKERFIELDKDATDHADRIHDLEVKNTARETRDAFIGKILYGTVASVALMALNSIWEFIKSLPTK